MQQSQQKNYSSLSFYFSRSLDQSLSRSKYAAELQRFPISIVVILTLIVFGIALVTLVVASYRKRRQHVDRDGSSHFLVRSKSAPVILCGYTSRSESEETSQKYIHGSSSAKHIPTGFDLIKIQQSPNPEDFSKPEQCNAIGPLCSCICKAKGDTESGIFQISGLITKTLNQLTVTISSVQKLIEEQGGDCIKYDRCACRYFCIGVYIVPGLERIHLSSMRLQEPITIFNEQFKHTTETDRQLRFTLYELRRDNVRQTLGHTFLNMAKLQHGRSGEPSPQNFCLVVRESLRHKRHNKEIHKQNHRDMDNTSRPTQTQTRLNVGVTIRFGLQKVKLQVSSIKCDFTKLNVKGVIFRLVVYFCNGVTTSKEIKASFEQFQENQLTFINKPIAFVIKRKKEENINFALALCLQSKSRPNSQRRQVMLLDSNSELFNTARKNLDTNVFGWVTILI